MDEFIKSVITVVAAVLASSGFWALLGKRMSGKDATTKLLLGLAHNSITTTVLTYIERDYVTQQEYENLRKYLYEPYVELTGGDPALKRIMDEVDHIRLVPNDYHEEGHRYDHE